MVLIQPRAILISAALVTIKAGLMFIGTGELARLLTGWHRRGQWRHRSAVGADVGMGIGEIASADNFWHRCHEERLILPWGLVTRNLAKLQQWTWIILGEVTGDGGADVGRLAR